MRRKISMDTLLTGLFIALLLLLLFYDPIRGLHPALDPLLTFSCQAIGLVLLALMVFCIAAGGDETAADGDYANRKTPFGSFISNMNASSALLQGSSPAIFRNGARRCRKA